MFNKKKWNKIKALVGIIMCAIAVFAAPSTTLVSLASTLPGVETYAEIKEWRWKIENDKLYKRLYNRSTGLWETDWMYVCDWPEGI